MKIDELFDKEPHGGKEEGGSRQYLASKRIGGREITFQARKDHDTWEVWFTEADKEGNTSWEKTGSGGEVEVFSFVVNCMRTFVNRNHPKRIQFTADKKVKNRVGLYRALVKRLGGDYICREFEVGMGSAPKQIQFDLIKKPTNEALDKPVEYTVTRDDSDRWTTKFTSGGREITFDADYDGDGIWNIAFTERTKKSNADFGVTGSGKEFEVFATLKKILLDFAKHKDPIEIHFTSDKKEPSRTKLYKRLFSNVPGWKLETDDNAVTRYTKFYLIAEGMMKRSDPYISGEKERQVDVGTRDAPTPAKESDRVTKAIENLAKRAKVSPEEVRKARAAIIKDVDPKHPNRWNIIQARLNTKFGL